MLKFKSTMDATFNTGPSTDEVVNRWTKRNLVYRVYTSNGTWDERTANLHELGNRMISTVTLLAQDPNAHVGYADNRDWRFVMDNALPVLLPAFEELLRFLQEAVEAHILLCVAFGHLVAACCAHPVRLVPRFDLIQFSLSGILLVVLCGLGCVYGGIGCWVCKEGSRGFCWRGNSYTVIMRALKQLKHMKAEIIDITMNMPVAQLDHAHSATKEALMHVARAKARAVSGSEFAKEGEGSSEHSQPPVSRLRSAGASSEFKGSTASAAADSTRAISTAASAGANQRDNARCGTPDSMEAAGVPTSSVRMQRAISDASDLDIPGLTSSTTISSAGYDRVKKSVRWGASPHSPSLDESTPCRETPRPHSTGSDNPVDAPPVLSSKLSPRSAASSVEREFSDGSVSPPPVEAAVPTAAVNLGAPTTQTTSPSHAVPSPSHAVPSPTLAEETASPTGGEAEPAPAAAPVPVTGPSTATPCAEGADSTHKSGEDEDTDAECSPAVENSMVPLDSTADLLGLVGSSSLSDGELSDANGGDDAAGGGNSDPEQQDTEFVVLPATIGTGSGRSTDTATDLAQQDQDGKNSDAEGPLDDRSARPTSLPPRSGTPRAALRVRQPTPPLRRTSLQADKQRVTSSSLHSQMVDALPGGVVCLTTHGKILAVNERTTQLLGHEASSLVGHSVSTLVPSSSVGHHGGTVRRLIAEASTQKHTAPRHSTVPLLKQDGSELSARIRMVYRSLSGRNVVIIYFTPQKEDLVIHDVRGRCCSRGVVQAQSHTTHVWLWVSGGRPIDQVIAVARLQAHSPSCACPACGRSTANRERDGWFSWTRNHCGLRV